MDEKQSKIGWAAFGVAAVVVVVVCVGWGWAWYPWAATSTHPGVFGDSFGALNTLFSGLAFAGVVAALFMQMRELRLQREALKLQHQEMRETRRELARQADVLEQQVQQQVRATWPVLRIAGTTGGNKGEQVVGFRNVGQLATSCCLEELHSDGSKTVLWQQETFQTGDKNTFRLEWTGKDPGTFNLLFSFDDVTGSRHSQRYAHEPNGKAKLRRVSEGS